MAFAKAFQVELGKKVDLSKHDPRDIAGFKDKDKTKAETEDDSIAIDALQNILYAEGKRSLLVVIQGIDSSGKDGTVRAVFNYCGPIGVVNTSFKGPSAEDLSHGCGQACQAQCGSTTRSWCTWHGR